MKYGTMGVRVRERGESRRREHLVDKALHAGLSQEFADQIYDVAEEEKIDPAIGFEVVLSGRGVRELAPPPDDAAFETQVEAPPVWLEPDTPAPDDAARERHLRRTFRRLRSLIESESSSDEALRKFDAQPDVGPLNY